MAGYEAAAGTAVDRLDGLTVDHGDWWYNLRPSNTEPLLRLNVEARTPVGCAATWPRCCAMVEQQAHEGRGMTDGSTRC